MDSKGAVKRHTARCRTSTLMPMFSSPTVVKGPTLGLLTKKHMRNLGHLRKSLCSSPPGCKGNLVMDISRDVSVNGVV